MASAGHPILAETLNHAAVALRVATNPDTSDQLLLSTLADLRPRLEEYISSEESGDDSDCVRGCDANLEACMEHWMSIAAEEQIDMPGGLHEGEVQGQDPGGSVNLEDNPVDVENSDPGVGSGLDDDNTSNSHQPTISDGETAMTMAICSIEFVVCLAACAIPG